MKKIIGLLVLATVILGLAGCQWFQRPAEVAPPAEQQETTTATVTITEGDTATTSATLEILPPGDEETSTATLEILPEEGE